jgi:hypothetical protein
MRTIYTEFLGQTGFAFAPNRSTSQHYQDAS